MFIGIISELKLVPYGIIVASYYQATKTYDGHIANLCKMETNNEVPHLNFFAGLLTRRGNTATSRITT